MTSPTFDITGTTDGATVQIINTATGLLVGQAVATGTTTSITTSNLTALGDGTYVLAARQTNASSTSPLSPTMTFTLDRSGNAITIPGNAVRANVGSPYTVDLSSTVEGNGGQYALTQAPAGLTINANTGLLSWTPTASQIGSQAVTVQLTDSAGNVETESFNIDVADEAVAGVDLALVDANGDPVTSLAVGDRFTLEFAGVDQRIRSQRAGLFSAFADVLFDPALVRVVPGTSIRFDSDFPTLRKGTVRDGFLDEIGAVNGSTSPTSELRSLIATVEFETIAPGVVTFTSEPADDSNSEVLLYFGTDRVPAGETSYGSASLTIGDSTFGTTADTFTVDGSTAQRLDVLANDTAAAGNTITLASVTQPAAGGSVAVDAGEVLFTPATGFTGTSSFTYTATDSTGATQSQNVTVTVNNADASPTAVADALTVAEDAAATTLDVTANDTLDPDGQAITVVSVTQGNAGGTVTIAADGQSIEYTPVANFSGLETATYTIRDTGGGQSTATITFTVTAVNDAPAAVDRTATALVSDADVVVLRADSFANVDAGETLRFVNLSAVAGGGTAALSAGGGEILFTPGADATEGTSTLTFQLEDPAGLQSSLATLTIDVQAFTRRDFIINVAGGPMNGSIEALRLRGTDATGQTIDLPLSDSSVFRDGNRLTIPNQLPGNFTIDVPVNPFFGGSSAGRSVAIQSGIDDGNAEVTIDLGTVSAEYIPMSRWFGSASRRTVLAVVSPGSTAVAMQANAAVNDLQNIGVDLNAAANSVTVRADRTTGTTAQALSGSAGIDNNGRSVRQIAQIGSQRLVEISLDNDGLALTAVPSTATATTVASAAGTSALSAAIAPDVATATSRSDTTDRGPSGEPLSVLDPPTSPVVSAVSVVDDAMVDVLPELQLRSPTGESTAAGESIETFAQSADRVFEGL